MQRAGRTHGSAGPRKPPVFHRPGPHGILFLKKYSRTKPARAGLSDNTFINHQFQYEAIYSTRKHFIFKKGGPQHKSTGCRARNGASPTQANHGSQRKDEIPEGLPSCSVPDARTAQRDPENHRFFTDQAPTGFFFKKTLKTSEIQSSKDGIEQTHLELS